VFWSADGSTLATVGLGGGHWVVNWWDPQTGSHHPARTGDCWPIDEPVLSPDHTHIAVATIEGEVELQTVADGSDVVRIRPSLRREGPRDAAFSMPVAMAWSPDSSRIAICWPRHQLQVHDTTFGHIVATFRDRSVKSVAWSPDGARLAALGADRKVRLWSLSMGGRLRRLLNRRVEEWRAPIVTSSDPDGWVTTLGWSSDGRHLATGHHAEVRVWHVAAQATVATFPGGAVAVAWAPDSASLAVGRSDGTIIVYALDDRTERARLCLGSLVELAWHGDRIAVHGAGTLTMLQLVTAPAASAPRPASRTPPSTALPAPGCA
jgi:WD40 repeat protein